MRSADRKKESCACPKNDKDIHCFVIYFYMLSMHTHESLCRPGTGFFLHFQCRIVWPTRQRRQIEQFHNVGEERMLTTCADCKDSCLAVQYASRGFNSNSMLVAHHTHESLLPPFQ